MFFSPFPALSYFQATSEFRLPSSHVRSTHPGSTQLTLMWSGAQAIARDLVRGMSAPLEAQYAAWGPYP